MNIRQRIYDKIRAELKILPYGFYRWLNQIINSSLSTNFPSQSILNQLQKFGCHSISHMDRDLLNHFLGTYQLLKKWGNKESVCLAGLCHALYGTETFPVALVPLEKRQEIADLIGEKAEKLAFYYSIITRQHFIENVKNSDNFAIKSRLDEQVIFITELEFRQLLEIFLADRLEQIFSLNYRFRYQYRSFFMEAKSYLSPLGHREFLIAYNAKLT
ncbi:MAG: DUF6817 domain-containing protein [Crocosphaera sp.]